MSSIMKLALIGSTVLGSLGSVIIKPPVIRNSEKVAQYTVVNNVKDFTDNGNA